MRKFYREISLFQPFLRIGPTITPPTTAPSASPSASALANSSKLSVLNPSGKR
jgi:hypothetical protein